MVAAATIGGALASTALGSALSSDNGAGSANAAATDATRQQAQIAQEQWNRYKQVYAPLEDSVVNDAQNYDTPARYAQEAGKASATVADQFGKARDRLTRTPGLDPSSAGYGANMAGLDLAQAATDATQQNAARRAVQDTAWARKSDVLSLGKGIPAQSASMLSSASQASLNQANIAYARSANEAAGLGSLTRDVIGGVGKSWANSPSSGYANTAATYSTTPGSQQTQMLAAQDAGL